MKLFTKICISVAAVALGIGVLGVGLGLAMGAELEDLNEMGIYLSPYHQKRVTTVEKYIEEEWEERKITETPLENWPQKEGVSEEKESSNVHHTNHNIHKICVLILIDESTQFMLTDSKISCCLLHC